MVDHFKVKLVCKGSNNSSRNQNSVTFSVELLMVQPVQCCSYLYQFYGVVLYWEELSWGNSRGRYEVT